MSSPGALALLAPAKVNLGLRVVGRRADGYHEIESCFVPLDLADAVEVEVRPEGGGAVSLRCEGAAAGVPCDASNLAARAAGAFVAEGGLRCDVALRLEKRIPVAAGLGGGSSDAAAVLRALARLLPGALDATRLRALALGLGADVPFFLDPRPARVSGVGERCEPLDGLPPFALLLANPGVPLSTAEVYRACDVLAQPGGAAPGSGGFGSLRDLAGRLANDLEPAAVRLCPPIARLRERIRQAGALGVGMSGSGPTVFGVFGSEAEAAAALERASFESPVWARVAVPLESG